MKVVFCVVFIVAVGFVLWSWPKSKPKTAVVWLSQSSHSSYGPGAKTFDSLLLSMSLVKQNAPWVRGAHVFVFGDFDSDQTKRIRSVLPAYVGPVPHERWLLPVPYDETWAHMKHFSLGYRKMINWWALEAFTWAGEAGFTCLVRFDDDSYVWSPMSNPCDLVLNGSAEYVCRAPIRDTFESPDFRNRSDAILGAMDHTKRIDCYNNFFAASVPWMLSGPYQSYVRSFQRDMFVWRLNDAILQSVAVSRLFPHGIVFVDDFTYEHARGNKVFVGGIWRGTADTNWTEHVLDFQRRHARSFRTVDTNAWMVGKGLGLN